MKFFKKPNDMKNVIVLIGSWLCVFATMLMIFCFSSQNAEKSTETSAGVVENVLSIFLPKEEITPEVVKKYQFPFRKAAHFGIYMLLGFSIINAFENTINKRKYISYILSLIVSALYAVSDEWHQNFSAGRGPSAIDVLIDTSGAVIGIALFFLFMKMYQKILSSKKPIR